MKMSLLLCLFSLSAFADVALKDGVNHVVIDAHDFESARVVTSIRLTETGAKKLAAYSANHVGEKLSVVLDGKTIASPTLRDPIVGRNFQLDALSPEQAEGVLKAINQ